MHHNPISPSAAAAAGAAGGGFFGAGAGAGTGGMEGGTGDGAAPTTSREQVISPLFEESVCITVEVGGRTMFFCCHF
jgi:hypothetical protein